jgi:hypothetical protein
VHLRGRLLQQREINLRTKSGIQAGIAGIGDQTHNLKGYLILRSQAEL